MQEQTETKPTLPCSADAASPLDNYPTGKLFLSSSSFSCQQTSSSCLVTFPSVPTGLFPFLEVVHNSRKDKVEGEGEQVLSVQPHSVTEASSLILPSPQEQSTDSPDDHPINTAGTAETGQCAVPWAGDSQRVKPTSRSWNYAQLDVAKDSGDGTGSFKKFTSYLPLSSSIIILSHSLALILLLGGTWMQGMLQHCQGHFKAGPGLEHPPCYTHRHPHYRAGAAGKGQQSPWTPGLNCPSYEGRHQDLWRSLPSQHCHSRDPKPLVLISSHDVMDDKRQD